MKLSIKKVSKKEFAKRLHTRDLENPEYINLVEKFLIKKRGCVFKMPKAGSSVVLLVSGGIDSTTIWALLMEKYKLNVYPVFLHRGTKRVKKEWRAVQFYSGYFKNKYPDLFHEPQEYSVSLPPPELEKIANNKTKYFHPLRILENLDTDTNLSKIMVDRGILPFTIPFFGVLHTLHLWNHDNIKVDTVFNAVTPGDGTVVSSQTFTALRSAMLSACIATNNFKLQIASPAFEKEIGNWLEKYDLIKLASKMRLPLEYTWSCYHSGIYQCGDACLTCHSRRLSFKQAGIKDKTHYESNDPFFKKYKVFRKKIRSLLDKIVSLS